MGWWLAVGSCPPRHGCAARPRLPTPGRKNARWPLEIRMFLWLNCFVAPIECVPGLALNSCTGLAGSSSGAQAAGTGIMLIVLESKSVPCLPCCHLPGSCGTGVDPRGRVWGMWGRKGCPLPGWDAWPSVHPSPAAGVTSVAASGCDAPAEPWAGSSHPCHPQCV